MKKAGKNLTESKSKISEKKAVSDLNKKSAEEWIRNLNLVKHPEGGWYKETYRSPEYIEKDHIPYRFSGRRSFSTSIYFLLKSDEFSAFHRIKQDEIWHFYTGSSLTIYVIEQNGYYLEYNLGLEKGEQPQVLIKAGCFFAAQVNERDNYTLVGCTVSPGFDFDDFELPSRERLLTVFPQHKLIITKFTKG
jgi:uncharacterized protein